METTSNDHDLITQTAIKLHTQFKWNPIKLEIEQLKTARETQKNKFTQINKYQTPNEIDTLSPQINSIKYNHTIGMFCLCYAFCRLLSSS